MPGNRLPLPVRVGCQIYFLRLLYFLAQIGKDFALSADGDILWLIIMLHIYSQRAFRQIADMPVAGGHLIVGAQEFLNGLHLCRRLYNYKIFCHSYFHAFLKPANPDCHLRRHKLPPERLPPFRCILSILYDSRTIIMVIFQKNYLGLIKSQS